MHPFLKATGACAPPKQGCVSQEKGRPGTQETGDPLHEKQMQYLE